MPVIRIPDDVFRGLQRLATPLVDTPASVIERLLNSHESNGGAIPLRASSAEAGNPFPDVTTAEIAYETYENRSNPHVTIHKSGCSQLRKRGGVHRHGQGSYKGHGTLSVAEGYARSTGLPIRFCGYCESSVDDAAALKLVIGYVRANPGRDCQEAEIRRETGISKNRVRRLVQGHPEIDQAVLAAGAVRWKPQATPLVP